MDSWLAYTLGYPTEVTANDIQVCHYKPALTCTTLMWQIACVANLQDQLSIDELIHTQTSKINLIAAEVAKTLASPELATKGNITMLTLKLEKWREEVPQALQIPTLLSSAGQDLTVFQRRAVFMLHVRNSFILV